MTWIVRAGSVKGEGAYLTDYGWDHKFGATFAVRYLPREVAERTAVKWGGRVVRLRPKGRLGADGLCPAPEHGSLARYRRAIRSQIMNWEVRAESCHAAAEQMARLVEGMPEDEVRCYTDRGHCYIAQVKHYVDRWARKSRRAARYERAIARAKRILSGLT
jgi:hypothetical protein